MASKPQPRRVQPSRPEFRWARVRTEPGWLLLPLRAFLGLTFTYAGLQKLANPAYLDTHSPTSVANQMLLLRHRSPLGPLLGLSLHTPTLVGLLIAFGELAVGVGTLLGLWARVAALGGALLALTFFLTVSWTTTPYYYGADIVFVFAWSVMLAFGAGGVLSADTWLSNRARRDSGLAAQAATVAVAVPRLRALCARGAKCALGADGLCTRLAGCPIFPVDERLPADRREQVDRRTLVIGTAVAGAVGILTIALGGITAAVGRAVGGTSRRAHNALTPVPPSTSTATPSGSPTPTTGGTSPAVGTAVATASSVSVGQAVSFTNPADGNPGWVVHTSSDTFVAFSAVCTHAGCPVQYDPSTVEFVCPCHGGVYDAHNGQVLQGPPPSPLPTIAVHVVDGQIRVG